MKLSVCANMALAAALSFGGLFLTVPSAYAQPLKKVSFLTNYVYNGRHTPFFVGREKGFYKEAGFDIDISPATGSGFVVVAVDSGRADYGMADIGSVVQGLTKGAKIKAIMVYTDVTTGGLASLAPFPKPESLLGKKIASSQGDSSRAVLPIIFGEQKLDASKIQWQTADPGVYTSLLISGQVDLITATSDGDMPALTKLAAAQGKKAHFSSFRDWGYDAFGFVLVGKAANLEQNPDEARRFAAATKKAVAYAIKNPDEAVDIVVKANPAMNRENVMTQWRGAITSIETPYVAQNGYGAATDDRIQRSIDLVKKAMNLEGTLKPDDVFALKGK